MLLVSITVSVPKETRREMGRFPEMNWSGFVRKSIVEKVRALGKLEELKRGLEKEEAMVSWSVKLQKASRSGRLEQLKRKGLI